MNGIRLLVWDLNAEFLFLKSVLVSEAVLGHPYLLNCHHNLHGIKAVKTEVLREVGRARDLSNVSPEHERAMAGVVP